MEGNFSTFIDSVPGLILSVGYKFVIAIVIIVVGFYLASLIKKLVKTLFKRNTKMDNALKSFIVSVIDILLKVVVFMFTLAYLGVSITSIFTMFSALGLAVGISLQGTFQNFAGGIIILMLKPYKVGEVIESRSYIGTVEKIQMFTTILLTPDHKTIIIPNNELANASLINYSREGVRRADIMVGIAYGESVDKAREVILKMIDSYSLVLKDGSEFGKDLGATIVVADLSDSSVSLKVMAWTESDNFVTVKGYLTEHIYNVLNENNITIAFPQLDVHIKNSAVEISK